MITFQMRAMTLLVGTSVLTMASGVARAQSAPAELSTYEAAMVYFAK